MVTAVYTHPDFEGHQNPVGHPERAARMQAVAAGLEGISLDRREAPLGAEADILRCHPPQYLARVRDNVPGPRGLYRFDPDTTMSHGSLNAALRGVGGACAALDAVVTGEVANAFVACRPPGHHAERETAMGFCIFGNVAIAARRALEVHGLARVAIVDFDVHHGNGTQDLIWNEARCLFISSHQMPLYPGTGDPGERGAHGQVVNVPLAGGTDGAAMRQAYEAWVFPALEAFKPELLLISAGFDAHADDPLAGLLWQAEDFAWLTGKLCDIAARHCAGRVVSCLEGGYDLAALTRSVAAHVKVLEERGR
jgi:acetoin utilization deacetylase AcuC-like enzyme